MNYKRPSSRVALVSWCCFALCSGVAHAQQLVPLADIVQEPLLPAGIANDDAVTSGQWMYLWDGTGGEQVLQFIGDFRFKLGSRTLKSRDAVIWVTRHKHQDKPYLYFEVFLWQEAAITDPGGAASTAPVLFATVATFGKLKIAADKTARESNAASTLFEDAEAVRQALSPIVHGESPPKIMPSPLTRIDFPISKVRTPVRSYSAKQTSTKRIGDELVATAIGDFFFSQTYAGENNFIEARADAATLFFNNGQDQAGNGQGDQDSRTGAFDLDQVNSIYLEGDVVLVATGRTVRAEKVFYDLENNRALILDPVMRLDIKDRNLPLYIRADEARQLSNAEFLATGARITTSEFYTPHYHLGAERIYFVTETAFSELEGAPGARSGEYRADHATLNLNGWPIMYWPVATGNFQEGETVIRDVRIGNDDEFGFSLETRWNLFSFFGLRRPKGFKDATLDIDYYTDRGLGIGVNAEYEFDTSYGEFKGYYIYDTGDDDNLGPFRDGEIDHPSRGRATWRHRQFLEDDWEFTLEASYLSDANFLEEYFEKEFDQDKEQETYFRLKKQRDNWALDLVAQVRINNWLDQTERLPEVSFRLIGEPVGPTTFFSENHLGILRNRPDERRLFISEDNNVIDNNVRSGAVLRADSRQELEWPLSIGPLKIVPFVVGRASWWDDSPHKGALDRVMGIVGVRGSSYLSRVFEGVQSDLWDLNGLRHIIKFDFTAWASAGNRSSRDLYPFDEGIEGIDDFSGATIGLRQRWQTKRGTGERLRTVDWITLDLEAGFFSNVPGDDVTNGYASFARPEESISSNYVSTDASWRLGDSTVLLADANYDLDGGDLDIANVSLAVERTPRFSYFVGWRRIDESESNLLGVGGNYRLSEKHAFALRHYSDLERGSTERLDLAYVRKFPRWYMSFTFALDEIEDNVSVSMAVWPEGFPNVALGGKRYTGLATSTAILPGD